MYAEKVIWLYLRLAAVLFRIWISFCRDKRCSSSIQWRTREKYEVAELFWDGCSRLKNVIDALVQVRNIVRKPSAQWAQDVFGMPPASKIWIPSVNQMRKLWKIKNASQIKQKYKRILCQLRWVMRKYKSDAQDLLIKKSYKNIPW